MNRHGLKPSGFPLLRILLAASALTAVSCTIQTREEDRHLPYRVDVTTRDRWPEGVPLRISINYAGPRIENQGVGLRYKAMPAGGGAEPASEWIPPWNWFVSWSPEYHYRDRTHEVGIPPAGADMLRFRTTVHLTGDFVIEAIPHWRGSVEVPVRVGGTVDDVLRPVADPEIDRLLVEGSTWRVRSRWPYRSSAWIPSGHVVLVDLEGLHPSLRQRDDVTFAVTIDLLCDDETLASGSGWWRGGARRQCGHLHDFQALRLESPNPPIGPFGVRGGIDRDITDEPDERTGRAPRWTLRIRSNPEMALRDFENDRYWSGDVTVPLAFPREIETTAAPLNARVVEQREQFAKVGMQVHAAAP